MEAEAYASAVKVTIRLRTVQIFNFVIIETFGK